MRALVKSLLLQCASFFHTDLNGKILFYHDVHAEQCYAESGTPLEMFKGHVAIARSLGFSFVRGMPDKPKTFHICLDDGFRGVWETREYFVKEMIFPTISLAVDLIGEPGYLNWNEILILQDMGFTFISHTWTHRSLTDVPKDELHHELADSRDCLSGKLGHEITALCFPRGRFSESIVEASRQAGYTTFYSSIPGSYGTRVCKQCPEIVPRYLVQNSSSKEFSSVLRGGANILTGRYRKQHFLEGV